MARKELYMSNSFISTLFGGGGSSSWMNGLYSSLSEYSSITSGNYYKLTKQYFNEFGSSATKSVKSTSGYDVLNHVSGHDVLKTDSSKDSDSTSSTKSASLTKYEQQSLTNNKTAATSASTLTSSLNALMNKKTYETSDTNTAENVKDTVSADVQRFAKDYNSLIDASKKSTASGVATATKYLMNTTSRYENGLKGIGVSVGRDGKLTVDTEALKNADTDTVKNLFSGGNNYGSAAGTYVSLAQYYANSAVSNGTYTSSGYYASSGQSSYTTTA